MNDNVGEIGLVRNKGRDSKCETEAEEEVVWNWGKARNSRELWKVLYRCIGRGRGRYSEVETVKWEQDDLLRVSALIINENKYDGYKCHNLQIRVLSYNLCKVSFLI